MALHRYGHYLSSIADIFPTRRPEDDGLTQAKIIEFVSTMSSDRLDDGYCELATVAESAHCVLNPGV